MIGIHSKRLLIKSSHSKLQLCYTVGELEYELGTSGSILPPGNIFFIEDMDRKKDSDCPPKH